MKRKVEEYRPQLKTQLLIEKANEIIEEYQEQGFDLTLRQLYYQFVSRDIIANNQKEYNNLGKIISKGRRGGFIDWAAITDRTRFLREWSGYENASEFLEDKISEFKLDVWDSQPLNIEVWFEKDALMGIFQEACRKYRIPFFSCRGYVSDSEMYSAAQRIASKRIKPTAIFHFGDHDPSGLDMTRDIKDRLTLFGASNFHVVRLALNYDQILEVNPPPNPAKESDSRFKEYQREYGDYSWELDALDPNYLVNLVHESAEALIDMSKFNEIIEAEKTAKQKLEDIADELI